MRPIKKTIAYSFLSLLILLAMAFQWQPGPDLTIYLIGDSTMADKPGTAEENPERGWGQLLPEFFNDRVVIKNHAVNGRSSKSFLDEGRWDTVLKDLRSGDYVFIQFGHNDQKENDPKRYTNPWTGYRRNLEKYVNDTRSKGAYPIILSSIVRRKFNEEGTLVDTHGVYPFVARQVAEQLHVPFIDMQLLTEDYVIALGPEKSKEIYLWVEPGKYEKFPDGKQDDTHLNLKGAREYARLVGEELRKQEMPLADFLK
ncbi:MAG: rhamnogalacturonan acetylesterase [Lewinellaceae bacterium]|nr:rhamnogalacturonan acetylesterase [Lewinellaceae bacterium]